MHEDNEERRFRTYLQYTCSLSSFVSTFTPKVLFENVVSSPAFVSIQGGRCQQIDRVSQLLRNAWMTEVLTRLAAESPYYALYANLWLPVQAYYSGYLALRALFLASGRTVSHDHANTLRTIARDIEIRPDLFAYPWKILCSGNPIAGQVQYHNLPEGVSVGQASPLAQHYNVDFADSFGMLLRTTRKRLIEDRCNDWRKRNRRTRVPAIERNQMAANLAPTSLFDCMYRMRLRSNYSDADSFLLTLHLEGEARDLSRAIVNITWNNAFMIELLICRYLGRGNYESIVACFHDHDVSKVAEQTVCARFNDLKTWW